MMCGKCSKMTGWIFLVLGLVFLLTDFGVWTFWGIKWWSALFFLGGLIAVCSAGCPDCQAVRGMKKK